MKDKLVHILKTNQDFVSGQALCQELNVSRTAIWKAMNVLKEEGYVIEAVNRKGYRLVQEPDLVTERVIRGNLTTKRFGKTICYQEEIDSTNSRAKILGEQGYPEGTLVVAEQQNGGRGRKGRQWISEKQSGIWMTLLLRPQIPIEKVSMLTLVAALAVANGIQEYVDDAVQIKWPNDIVINGKKVCGILTEMSTELDTIHYVVVGIGINVHTKEFSETVKDIATSIYLETGKHIARAELIGKILEQFQAYYDQFVNTQSLEFLMEEYNSRLVNIQKEVLLIENDEEQSVLSKGIDETGALVVERENGVEERIIAGEVSVRGLYGYV